MMDATNLVRAGKLGQAMALIRRVLPGGPREPSRTAERVLPIDLPPLPDTVRGILARVGGFATPAPEAEPATARGKNGFHDHVFANAAGKRSYKLFVPTGYRGQALPLVVMLHGCTQSPDDFAAGTRMNQIAEEANVLVAYPAQSQSANISKCWNWFNEGDQHRDAGEPSLIAGITRQVMKDYAVKPGSVFVAGLSAGGAAAAIMGATYPELYAAVGVHSGLACGAAHTLAAAGLAMRRGAPPAAITPDEEAVPIPTIVFHGDKDNTVNQVNAGQVIAQAKAGENFSSEVSEGTSPDGMKYTRTVLNDIGGRPVLEQWILHGAGHAWSGGSSAGSYASARGPDASREMLRFFLQHARPQRHFW